MSGRELFQRHAANPILTADDWPITVNTVFNPGAALVDGTTVILARVEDRRGISTLHVARSADGIGDWVVAPEPLLAPDPDVETEHWGFEDPRIVWAEELGAWVVTCTAYGRAGPAVYLATTTDFDSVERVGIIREPEDKNAAILSERIDGKWVLFHRPRTTFGDSRWAIVLSRSDDLRSWSTPEPVMQPRHGAWWDSLRIGIGPPPLRTEHGWLMIYHGVKQTVAGSQHRVGLALTALDDPGRVLHRAEEWVLSPTARYERVGDIPNVVFPCGLVHDARSGELRLYYGAADTTICLATARLDEVLATVLASPPG